MNKIQLKDIEIEIIQADITQLEVEAIVNAANDHFYMGGGVAGAIKHSGGKEIEDEAVKKGPVKVGESIITKAGKLKAKYVIHAATMGLDFKTDEDIIRKATASAINCAQKNNIASLAFCALGCGVGGFSYESASKIMAQEIFRYSNFCNKPNLKKIIFVLSDNKALDIFKRNICLYLDHLTKKMNEGPFVTVDGIIKYQGGIVLIERTNPPLGWALPGGFVDYGESVETAVVREVQEETNLVFKNFKLFKVCSAPNRDPRFHTVTIIFSGEGEGILKADSDAKNAKVFSLDQLPEKIAFDHRQIIREYFDKRC